MRSTVYTANYKQEHLEYKFRIQNNTNKHTNYEQESNS